MKSDNVRKLFNAMNAHAALIQELTLLLVAALCIMIEARP